MTSHASFSTYINLYWHLFSNGDHAQPMTEILQQLSIAKIRRCLTFLAAQQNLNRIDILQNELFQAHANISKRLIQTYPFKNVAFECRQKIAVQMMEIVLN
jgi:hypothetical protein